ncbi:MAG: antibiotic biosynthesis monooxygenase family protein [Dehalococcoidia bacterium]
MRGVPLLTAEDLTMQAKVLIERHVAPLQESHALAIATELRAAAIRQPGYISGETLIDIGDSSTIIVVSTWRTVEDWKRWESSVERKRLEANMEPLLSQPTIVRLCADAVESLATAPGRV